MSFGESVTVTSMVVLSRIGSAVSAHVSSHKESTSMQATAREAMIDGVGERRIGEHGPKSSGTSGTEEC